MFVLYVQDWISGLIDTYTEELACLNMKNKQPEKNYSIPIAEKFKKASRALTQLS